jgi:hypothetical protein
VLASHGGQLASDSAPKLIRINTSTDKGLRIQWAAAGVIEITNQFVYPLDFDASQPVVVSLVASMGGATDTPAVAVGVFDGVGDTNRGGNTAAITGTTVARYTKSYTPAGAAGTGFASISLTPAAHGTDVLNLYGAFVTYTRKGL